MSDNRTDDQDVPVDLSGLPEHIARELAPTWNIRSVRWFGNWAQWLIMCAGFGAGFIWLWPEFESINERNALAYAAVIDGLLYDVNFGFGFLVWLFAWIFLSGVIAALLVVILPMPAKGALFFGVSSDLDLSASDYEQLEDVMAKAGPMMKAGDFVNAWCIRIAKSTMKYSLPLVLLGALLLVREVETFSIYSEQGYFRSPLLPWASKTMTRWEEADRVELGCNQTDDGGSVVYQIHFRNGKSIRIEDGIPVGRKSWLGSLETIDGRLARAGATFERWSWLARDPLHPGCLRGYYRFYGKERGDRLMRILRVGDFEGDTAIDSID